MEQTETNEVSFHQAILNSKSTVVVTPQIKIKVSSRSGERAGQGLIM